MFFLRYFPLSIIFPFFYSKEKMEGKRCNERRRRRISFVLLEDAERAKYANIERRKQKAKKKMGRIRWHATFMPLYARVKFNEHSFSN